MGLKSALYIASLSGFLGLSPGAAIAEPSWSLTTDLKLETLYWPYSYGTETNNQLYRVELIPNLKAKLSESSRLYIRPYFQWDPANKSPDEQSFLDLGEAYYKYLGESFTLQAGSNIVNWGVTDGYNPLDIVNTRQYFDPLRSVKQGALSLLISHSSEGSEQELIYIPKNKGSVLPGPHSRWLPRKVYIPRTLDNDVILLLPETLTYSYSDRQTLNEALDNNLGTRWQWHLGPVDLSLSAFEGVANFPLIQARVTGTALQLSPKVILQTDSNVVLNTKNYRQRAAGFTWVSSQAGFLFKYATQYSQSLGEDPLLPGWMHENVLGLEKNFSIGSDAALIAILQHSFIRNQKDDDSNLSVTEIFRRAWMLGGRLTWQEVWTLNAMALYDSIRYSHFQQISIARRLQDIWTLQISAEFVSGQDDTPLGVYKDNDNYRLSLSRSF